MKGNKFARVEQKYILDNNQYKKMQQLIDNYFLKDIYYESKISNIYFDNKNNDLLINSIEKPLFKKKIRVRSYGEKDTMYFEIKEKYKGTVYKRRVKLSKQEFDNYLNDGIIPSDKQIMKEIDYYVKYYKLEPYMYLAYDRLSYYSIEDSEFRITFDRDLRYRYDNLSLDIDKDNMNYFKDKKYIMEVKSLNSLPLWFVKFLSENKIYPQSFSKIGSIYVKEREMVLC